MFGPKNGPKHTSSFGLRPQEPLLAPSPPGDAHKPMPPKGFVKPEPVDRRLKVGLSASDYDAVSARAANAGMTTAAYVRHLIAFDLGQGASPPKARSDRNTLALLAEVHLLAMQVKKIGVNVNQMARQANTGLVPLTIAEMRVMQAQVGAAMEQAVRLFDKVLTR